MTYDSEKRKKGSWCKRGCLGIVLAFALIFALTALDAYLSGGTTQQRQMQARLNAPLASSDRSLFTLNSTPTRMPDVRDATATVRAPSPTAGTSDKRCLTGLEPLSEDIWQTIDDARYLAQTFFDALGSQDVDSWGGEDLELDEFIATMLREIGNAVEEGQGDLFIEAIKEVDLTISDMWRNLSIEQSAPVAQLIVSIADAHALLIDCEFGDNECANRHTIRRAEATARAFRELADAGEGCTGFEPLADRLRNLAEINLAVASELTE